MDKKKVLLNQKDKATKLKRQLETLTVLHNMGMKNLRLNFPGLTFA